MVKFRFFDPDAEKGKPAQTPPIAAAAPPVVVPIVKSSQPAVHSPSGFTLNWIHKHNWRQNPFDELQIKPAHVYVVNQDTARQHINLFFIKEKQYGHITGAPGSGKTFMLHWLAEELQPYGDRFLVYGFEGSVQLDTFIQKIVAPCQSIIAKYKGNSPEELSEFLKNKAKKRIVLLIDNADNISDQIAVYVKTLLMQNNAVVVMCGVNPPKLAHDDLSVHLSILSSADVAKILERRIAAVGGEGIEPFNNRLVEELWKASGQNLKTFLNFCNETAMKIALKQFSVPQEVVEEEPAPTKKAGKTQPIPKVTAVQKEKTTKAAYDDFISGLVK